MSPSKPASDIEHARPASGELPDAYAAAALAAPAHGAPRSRGLRTRIFQSRLFGYVASLTAMVIIWQLVVSLTGVADYVLPAPASVAERAVDEADLLWQHMLVTTKEILVAFGLSIVLGMVIAIGISFSRTLERLVYPLLVTAQAVPKIAIAPVLIIWFGFGMVTNVLVAVLVAVFPIIVNTALGLQSLEPDMVRLGRIMGANRWRLFWKIRLPAAMPSIFAGLKLGITFATIGAVVGEFIGSTEGLGYIAQVAAGGLDSTLAFASITLLAILGIVLFVLVEAAETVMLRWHVSQRATS